MSLAICASRRIASSVRCINSLLLGKSMGSGASVGLATGGAIAGAALSCAISSLACFSNCSTFCVATASSLLALSRGRTGNGVLARRLASVFPPPSRLACARISALVGLDFDLALTSATSSGGPLRSSAESSKGLNLSASTNAWSRIEPPTAVASSRSEAVGSATRNGSDIVRGSDTGTGPRVASSARLAARHARGEVVPAPLPWSEPGVTRLERHGEKVDAADDKPHAGVRSERRQVGDTSHQRQRVETNQVLAHHRCGRLGHLFLREPAQAPVMLHAILELGVL